MADPTALSISREDFASIRDQLDDGFGFFIDGDFKYVVLDADTHTVDVLRRVDDSDWTDVMVKEPRSVRVAVNGQLFGPGGLYVDAFAGSVSPEVVEGEGSIRQEGRTHREDAKRGENRYYFGRTKNGKRYRCDLGNPPEEIYEGMGGLGPLIVTNPVTGDGVPAGIGNRYASDSGKTNKPVSDEDWKDCTRRNSEHFRIIDEGGTEFCAVGASSKARLLIFVINESDADGQLSILRDKLLDAGFDCACFTDGSSSSCMAVDHVVVVSPAEFKDNLIEAGFKGVRKGKLRKFRVRFKTLEVLDPAVVEGDEGRWNLAGSVNGAEVGSWLGARTFEGQTLDLGWETEIEVSSANSLTVHLAVDNVVPETMTGVPGPEVPDFVDASHGESDPPFGEGSWVVENSAGFYKLRFSVEAL